MAIWRSGASDHEKKEHEKTGITRPCPDGRVIKTEERYKLFRQFLLVIIPLNRVSFLGGWNLKRESIWNF